MNRSLYCVAGLGKTGLSIARYLRQKDHPFVLFDTRQDASLFDNFRSEFPDVPLCLGKLPDDLFTKLAAIVASPGVSLQHPLLVAAKQKDLPIFGDIECLAQEIKAPVVAITGTNGKSTVTTLVGEMAKQAGLRVAVAGNIGTPVLDCFLREEPCDLWVLELSSFQLELTSSLAPMVSTILNVSPDHLDRHETFASYVNAKQRVYRHAKSVLYNRQDEATYPKLPLRLETPLMSFGLDAPKDNEFGMLTQNSEIFLSYGNEIIVSMETLRLKGIHNGLNALSACALAKASGIPIQDIQSVLKSFSGLPHRCQWVRTLDGVDWINDSKGTNVGATISAITGLGNAITGKIVLIAGGQGKGADFRELNQSVKQHVRAIVLVGEDALTIENALQGSTLILRADSMAQAIVQAQSLAVPHDVVLLSPACASFDMFRDYIDRGNVFTTLVNGLSS